MWLKMFKKCKNHPKTTNFKFILSPLPAVKYIFINKYMLVLIEKNVFVAPSATVRNVDKFF
jgi:hypothetical protein